jgi:hypothetical protein
MPVDRLDTERQHRTPSAGHALEVPDALAKLLDSRTGNGGTHVLAMGSEGHMFIICSHLPRESIGVLRNEQRIKENGEGRRLYIAQLIETPEKSLAPR